MELASLTARVVYRSSVAPSFPYPISQMGRLQEALAQHLGVAPGNVVVGAGSDALLKAALLSLVPHNGTVGVTSPGYDLLAALPAALGRRIRVVQPDEIAELASGLDAFLLASPDYPSGRVLSLDVVRRLTGSGVVLLDQAYHEYIAGSGREDLSGWIDDRTVLFRTCSKFRGRPDLRVGWAVTSTLTARRIEEQLLPFPCSGNSLDEARRSLSKCKVGRPGPGIESQLRAVEQLEVQVRALGYDLCGESLVPWLWIPDCGLEVLDNASVAALVRVAYRVGKGLVLKT